MLVVLYLLAIVVAWTVVGFFFTVWLWPLIVKKLEKNYPPLDKRQ